MRRNIMSYPGVLQFSHHRILKSFPWPPKPIEEKKPDIGWSPPIYLNLILRMSICYVDERETGSEVVFVGAGFEVYFGEVDPFADLW